MGQVQTCLDFERACALDRFWSKVSVDHEGGCWEWTGARSAQGYGNFAFEGATLRAHRALFIATYGAFDPKLVVDHLCRNRACVNPDHMEAVTNRENLLRGNGISARYARREKCGCGRPLTPARNPKDGRECLPCLRAAWTANNERRRQRWDKSLTA